MKTTVRHPISGSVATVVIGVKPSDAFKIESKLKDAKNDLQPPSTGSAVTLSAVEAACCSGAAFGRRIAGASGLEIMIESVEGRIRPDEVTGFAIATAVAVVKSVKANERLSQKDLEGWNVDDG
jgi:hypothetical protein